jgi:hypothetical protein
MFSEGLAERSHCRLYALFQNLRSNEKKDKAKIQTEHRKI